MTGRKILVAEDSPTQAEQLKALLEAAGYAVTVVANGKDALAVALRDRPALVISDILMPEMDGYTLCQRIKADDTLKNTPVVLVTALSGPHDIIRALECGADNVVRKPYDEQQLLSRLRYIEVNRELRGSEKMQIGIEIDVAGQRHFISADRRQILDLLISAYEEAVHLNEELGVRQGELERSSQCLEGLYRIAEDLNRATSEQAVVAAAVARARDLPGVQAGWVVLREGETGFRLAGASGLPPALLAPGAMDGDCLCRRRLLSGDLDQVTNILECERLAYAKGDTRGLRHHASIPLWIGDHTLGALNLAGPGPGFFSDADLKVLYGVGNQFAVALERARLLERLERDVAGRTAELLAEIGERKRGEKTLRQSEKLAAMGELLAGVAHELNNPLTVIVGQAALLHREVDSGPVKGRAEQIDSAAKRCARIVKNFLALARQQPPERQSVSLNQIVQETVELLAYQLRLDNVEVALDLDPQLPPLWADPNQLQQVTVNLVTNAHHAMRQAPLPRRLRFSTRADRARATLALEVADTGPGIPAEIQARIFEPFFTTKPPGQGTGLGLSICRGIIESHGGSITVTSQPGHGAAFLIELPERMPDVASPAAAQAEAMPPTGGKTILVVDDEQEVANVIADILSAAGHAVEKVSNGALALDKLGERLYDVILSDARMPELDGPGLYREVARRHPEMVGRFVILTGDTLSAETWAFIEETGIPSLTKPFSPEELRRAVDRAVRSQ